MAQKTQIILIDDVDGGDADETVSFALDGVSYEIDLNDENAAALREAFGAWLGHSRRVGGRSSARRSGRASRQAAPAAGASNSEIREWARENNFEVSDRGRISAHIQEAYAAAH